ncbi:MAG: hydantoinase/oxoprolinase family protein [Lautropia sp.]
MSETADGVRHVLGCDVGGTFTDVVVTGGGRVVTLKVSSTPDDYSRAILSAIRQLRDEFGIDPGSIDAVVHATTVATNTILEHKGARTALVTTEGFRDVLEMRRLRIPVMYDLQYEKPVPLVPRRRRYEIDERLDARGAVRRPLNEAQARQVAERIAAEDVEAVAVSFLHAYVEPRHEARMAELLRERLGPAVYVSTSARILPEIREYERTSTAVVNAYIGPVVRRYVDSLAKQLREAGVRAPLQIMQSNGGTMSAQATVQRPACIVESGPAAGVIACAAVARAAGLENVISFDMGGTTAKAAIVEGGEPATTTEYEVGAGINISSKLVKGGGYAIKLPFIDVSEIGAGGGSIVSLDAAGAIRVGPRSAGSVPGPACYGQGGDEPTFTDAAVVLGYLNPEHLAGGRLPIDAARSRAALRTRVAEPLGLALHEAAWGVYAIAVATMTRAVKAVSTYRGRDPREFALVAFGGNGPVAAVAIARELNMRTVLIPPAPGVFSATGLLISRQESAAQCSVLRRVRELDPGELAARFASLESEVRNELGRDGLQADAIEIRCVADLRYSGQAFELSIPLRPGVVLPSAIEADFHAEHARTYGHSSVGDPVDLVNIRVIASAPAVADAGLTGLLGPAALSAAPPARARRLVWFGHEPQGIPTRVIGRGELLGGAIAGPCIIEEPDATCVVPPGATARLDAVGNILIDTGAGA